MQWESHIVPPLPEKKSNFFEIRAAKGLPGDWGTPQRVLLFDLRGVKAILVKTTQPLWNFLLLRIFLRGVRVERKFFLRYVPKNSPSVIYFPVFILSLILTTIPLIKTMISVAQKITTVVVRINIPITF